MNRNRPPMAMPAPGFQTPPFGAPQGPPQGLQPVFAPDCLDALIRQSESNYMIARDRTMKFDEASGALEMEAQNMSIELANRGMTSSHDPVLRATEIMRSEMRAHRTLLDAVLRSELALQGNFKRWASGQMPMPSSPTASVFTAPLPPPPPIPTPYGGPQQTAPFQPQQGFAPPPNSSQQSGAIPPPPPGGVDYRDPRQAAEALLRAAPMPMMQQPQPVLQQQPQGYPQQQPYPQQQQAAYPQPYPYPQQQQGMPQYAYPSPQQQPMPQEVMPMPVPMQQQPAVGAQTSSPMPTSMQFEQPPPAQQTPHQAAPVQANGAAKA